MSVTKCLECGAVASTLAMECTVCGTPALPRAQTVFSRLGAQKRIPIVLLACTLTLTLPVVAGRAMEYWRTVAAERANRERSLAEERAREARVLQVRMEVRADSARRSLPSSRLRQARLPDLRAAVGLVGAYRADSAARWLAAARTEITRREKVENERSRVEAAKRERAAARTQAALRARAYTPPPSGASRGYYTGPRGGCYTYSASGRKRYVDRSLCN
jgi:hypothetical protein